MKAKLLSLLVLLIFSGCLASLSHVKSQELTDQALLNGKFLEAAHSGSQDLLIDLLKQGAEVNACDIYGNTALFVASWRGYLGRIEALIEAKAAVNDRSNNGHAALHSAAEGGHKDCIEALVGNQADVIVCDRFGKTPLYRAVENNRVDAVKVLVKYSYRIRLSKRAVYDSRKRIVNALLLFARVRKPLEEGGLQLTDLGNTSLQFEILSKSKLLQKDLVLILLDELQEGREMRPGLLSKSKDAAVEYLLEMVTKIVSKIDQSTMMPAMRDLLDRSTIKELLKEGLNERCDQLKVKKNNGTIR